MVYYSVPQMRTNYSSEKSSDRTDVIRGLIRPILASYRNERLIFREGWVKNRLQWVVKDISNFSLCRLEIVEKGGIA